MKRVLSDDDELAARLVAKHGRHGGLPALFVRMVEEDEQAAKPLVRAKAVLQCARGLGDQALQTAVAQLPKSAAEVRKRYKELYKDASREREDELRECKLREVVCLIGVRLEALSRLKRDPVATAAIEDLLALFESAAVLLTNPSIGALLDLVDFCWDLYETHLGATLTQVWEELEVEPHSRGRGNAAPQGEGEEGGEAEPEIGLDKKKIKTELASKAEAVLQQEQQKKQQKKPPAPLSLGSVRMSEKTKNKAKTAVPAPAVIVQTVKFKKKSPMKKKMQ